MRKEVYTLSNFLYILLRAASTVLIFQINVTASQLIKLLPLLLVVLFSNQLDLKVLNSKGLYIVNDTKHMLYHKLGNLNKIHQQLILKKQLIIP